MKLGIDIGGTFTDFVLLSEADHNLYFAKTLTTYPDPTVGIMRGIEDIFINHGIPLTSIKAIVHGTTLVTNAIIERKGAKTGLLTTIGFEDVLEIGREMRYDIYDIFITMPKPLVPSKLRRGIIERVNFLGEIITNIDESNVKTEVDGLVADGVESIAVSYLHSYANPAHELKTKEIIKSHYPHITCSLSCEVMPEIREYERTSATVMNAYVQPIIGDYLNSLIQKLADKGYENMLHIMDSAGRLTTIEGAIAKPVQLLESGPAGGTMAGVFLGKLISKKDLVAFDMGGTTAKASIILDFEPEITNHFEAAREKRFKKGSGLPVRIPVIDMIEIGAGGGSIARLNSLGLLTVGPESASSTPGPACYDRGGENPTVTDADLVLGYLNEQYFLGGTMLLRKDLSIKAIKNKIADPLGITVEQAAWGIHRMVNENMANAARVHIIEKGLDPRFFSVLAFGGAGPVHAFHVARLMKSPQLIVPSGAGVLSALGFLVSPIAKEEITSFIATLDKIEWFKLNHILDKLKASATQFLRDAGVRDENISVSIISDMRYEGQGHEISVKIPEGILNESSIASITQNFEELYIRKYGRVIKGLLLESITWRILAKGPNPDFLPNQAVSNYQNIDLKGHRQVYFGEKYIDTPVYDRYSISPHKSIVGPCIIEEFESTTVVGPNANVMVDEFKNIIINMTYEDI